MKFEGWTLTLICLSLDISSIFYSNDASLWNEGSNEYNERDANGASPRHGYEKGHEHMHAAQRIEKVQRLLHDELLDAIVVRNVSDLMWVTGFEDVFDTEQAHVAIITRDECIIHTDTRYDIAMREHAAEEGIWKVDASKDREPAFVARMLQDMKLVTGRIAIDDSMPLALYRAYSDAMPNARFKERGDDILKLRAVKDADEVTRMQRAQDIASRAFLDTIAHLQPGMTERDVSIELEFNMKRQGADELAFANIVASGPNGAKPHAVPGNRMIEQGDFVVIDFGARVGGYCSDTTRTICIGEANSEQRAVYEAVRSANEQVSRALRPGVTGAQMHALAESVLAKEGFEGKMGHALGHGVGIDVHELPVLSARNKEPLLAGNVVTDEPGVYLPGSLGVRIEDCGVVTDDGFRSFCNLTHELIVVS